MPATILIDDFCKFDSLHDGLVMSSDWEGRQGRLTINLELYLQANKVCSYLSIVLNHVSSTQGVWPKFDMYYFDAIPGNEVTYETQDMVTGETVQFVCQSGYIILDDIYVCYMREHIPEMATLVQALVG